MKIPAFFVACALLFAACTGNKQAGKLPIMGQRDVNAQGDTVYHTVPPVSGFVSQNGDSITAAALDGKIYVADFFFTTCPSICPVMHRNMLKVHEAYKDAGDFKIISYTIDPKYDSAAVLKKYADKLAIDNNSWWLLQGQKEATYALAKSYLVTTPQVDEKEKFVHDGYFILVDKQRRIRGMYDGTVEEQVAQLIEDVKTLRAEPEQQSAQ